MSVADYALVPLQDMLDLGSECRMNRPAQGVRQLGVRFRREQLTDFVLARLRDLTKDVRPPAGDRGGRESRLTRGDGPRREMTPHQEASRSAAVGWGTASPPTACGG